MTDNRRGVFLGIAAYVLWGLSPIFWKIIDHVPAMTAIAWRVVATFVLVLGARVVLRRPRLRGGVLSDGRARLAGLTAGLLIGINWVTFVWAVGADRVTEVSLGYFMNPLVSVILGVMVLGERLRRLQWVAVACAAAGVAWLTIDVGTVPWVSLTLAGTFALYGLIKKVAPTGPLDGLTIETGVLLAPAIGFLLLAGTGGTQVAWGPGTTGLLLATGIVTAVPLLLFAASARRVPLSVVGLLQYIAPTIQFLLGVVVYGETFDGGEAVGFAMVWAGLAVFAADGLQVANRARRTFAAV